MSTGIGRKRGRRAAIIILAVFVVVGPAPAQQPLPVDPNAPDLQVLARGPIHEAFAGPVIANPTAGAVAAERVLNHAAGVTVVDVMVTRSGGGMINQATR